MIDLLARQDWVRVLVLLTCSVYLLERIYIKTDMLLKRELGFIEVATDSEEMKFPSVTFCPASTKLMPHEYNKVDNITADYQNVTRIEDMLTFVRQRIRNNK